MVDPESGGIFLVPQPLYHVEWTPTEVHDSSTVAALNKNLCTNHYSAECSSPKSLELALL